MIKWALLAPAVILCVVFLLWPMVEVGKMSLTRTNFVITKFVGLQNYRRIFTDAPFLRSIVNSVIYILLCVPAQVGGALLIVLAVMDLPKKWHDGVRFIFYIPSLSAGMIIASIWLWIFHFEGPVNWLLGTDIWWYGAGRTAIPAVALVTTSVSMGGIIIILLAATLSIDKDLFDAAKIDGARPWQIKRRIVVPIIAPTIALMVLLGVIATPQIIQFIIALAPYEYASTMAYSIYREAFAMSRMGPASAQAMVLLVWMLGMAWVKAKVTRYE